MGETEKKAENVKIMLQNKRQKTNNINKKIETEGKKVMSAAQI